jgi:hypothetical protein
VKIRDLPVHERPVDELLDLPADLDDARPTINTDYAGYGWAHVDEIWLDDQRVRDAVVLAVHSSDDAAPIADDIELEFELPDAAPVTVLASQFLEQWLPQLPPARAVVLAMCNPHHATLRRPAGAPTPLYYATGDVEAWLDELDDGDVRIRLAAAGSWVRLHDVTTALARNPPITEDQKQSLIGLWLLKKLDLKPEDGGMEMPVVVPSELGPLDDYLQQLAVEDYVQINQKKGRYELTKKGLAYLGQVIDEAQDMVDDLDELETEEAVAELRARNLDLLRARFLWGWYEGEFDDMVLFQERRGVQPVERMWAFYLTSDDFFRELAKDFAGTSN